MKRYAYELPDHRIEYGVNVPIEDLHTDPQAQRNLNEQRAQAISRNLVPTAVGTLTISRRDDGRMYIVDGQHRHRACRLAGWSTMVAEVHHGLTMEQEAVLFLIKNKESRAPSAVDEFMSG